MSRAVDSTARAMAGEALSRLDNGGSGSGGTTVDAYSKLETDNLLNAKVDDVEFTPIKALAESNEINITYLANNKAEKTEVNALSELVADIDSKVDLKANASDVYTKAETNTAISDKVAEIVANAPEDLDTLKEIADWIDSHKDSASAMNTAIKQNTSDIATLKATDETTATEIASVKSDVAINRDTIGVQHKNLFDIVNAKLSQKRADYTVTDGSIIVTASSQYTTWSFVTLYFPELQVGTEYTFSADISNVSVADTTSMNVGIAYDSSGANRIVTAQITDTGKISMTFIPSESEVYILFYVNYSKNENVGNTFTATEIMLRYADIIDDTYEPYKPSLQEQITTNKNNIADIMTGVYLYNKSYYGAFTDGYVMRIGNQVHIDCKLNVTKALTQWAGSVVILPFKVKSPNSDGSRYTITNTQSDSRTTSIYIDEGSESFFSSTTFSVGDVIEIKGLILDMYVDDTATTQEA